MKPADIFAPERNLHKPQRLHSLPALHSLRAKALPPCMSRMFAAQPGGSRVFIIDAYGATIRWLRPSLGLQLLIGNLGLVGADRDFEQSIQPFTELQHVVDQGA